MSNHYVKIYQFSNKSIRGNEILDTMIKVAKDLGVNKVTIYAENLDLFLLVPAWIAEEIFTNIVKADRVYAEGIN